MGRRAISTTKSGKFMNPTDQARKEARKKELKKNKKQRLVVRQAVLKNKNPSTIFIELEKLDAMEFNPDQPAPLNEKVLKEKRKKLIETLERIKKLHEKETPDTFSRIKRMEQDYDKRRTAMMQYFESVQFAQQVAVDDIPLPALPSSSSSSSVAAIPTPAPAVSQPPYAFGQFPYPYNTYNYTAAVPRAAAPQGILKKTSKELPLNKKPPGVPACPPPRLEDFYVDYSQFPSYYAPTAMALPTAVSAPSEPEANPAPPGEEDVELPEASTEEESVNEKKTTEPAAEEAQPTSASADLEQFMKEVEGVSAPKETSSTMSIKPPAPMMRPPGPPPGLPHNFRPSMLPPPPPLSLRAPNMRLPPGPPRLMRPPGLGLVPTLSHRPTAAAAMGSFPPQPKVVAAPPQVHHLHSSTNVTTPGKATIEAKPQIRNVGGDVTRFMPTSLRVKRDEKRIRFHSSEPKSIPSKPSQPSAQPTKDDAYDQFMKEMQGLV